MSPKGAYDNSPRNKIQHENPSGEYGEITWRVYIRRAKSQISMPLFQFYDMSRYLPDGFWAGCYYGG